MRQIVKMISFVLHVHKIFVWNCIVLLVKKNQWKIYFVPLTLKLFIFQCTPESVIELVMQTECRSGAEDSLVSRSHSLACTVANTCTDTSSCMCLFCCLPSTAAFVNMHALTQMVDKFLWVTILCSTNRSSMFYIGSSLMLVFLT